MSRGAFRHSTATGPSEAETKLSVKTALARPFGPQCVHVDALLLTTDRLAKKAGDLTREALLLSTDFEPVAMEKCIVTANWEKDFVKVHVADSHFLVTSDHIVEAAKDDGWPFSPVPANELKAGMVLRSLTEVAAAGTVAEGTLPIAHVDKMPRLEQAVVQFTLANRNMTIWLQVGQVAVSVFGAQPCNVEYRTDLARRSLYISPRVHEFHQQLQGSARSAPTLNHQEQQRETLVFDDGFAPSRGSQGHPECSGACGLFSRGSCTYGILCDDCHVQGCTRRRIRRVGRNQRQRQLNNAG